MHTFLWVFIAGAIGLMLFATLQDELPPEMSFLKLPAGSTSVLTAPEGTPSNGGWQSFQVDGWEVQRSGQSFALSRPFRGLLTVNGQTFDTPQLGLLCHEGDLTVRIDTRLPTTGTQTTSVVVAGQAQTWDKGAQGFNILAKDSKAALAAILKADSAAEVRLSYRDLGAQSTYVSVASLPALVAEFPASCRP